MRRFRQHPRLPVSSTRAALLALLLPLVPFLAPFAATTASGQPEAPPPRIEAPSSYVEEGEERDAVGGMMGESDAEIGQAEEAERTGEPATGLSQKRTEKVESIVVTARKREELLEETPIAVTALPASELREAGVVRLDQIQELVPNLQFAAGRENQEGFIRIRGIGTNDGQLVFDPGVGVYVDGVFLSRMIGQLIDVMDVGQIEVLRGPQGTLFGKNTVGGAINITTVKPSNELEGFAFVRPGNFDSLSTRAMLNIPIVEDKLLSRFAIGTQNSAGYTYNSFLDETWSDRNAVSFLGSLRALPRDDITIDVSGAWGRDNNHGRGGQCVVVSEAGIGGLVPGFFDACRQSQPFDFEANVASISDTESYGVWGTGQWDAGSAWVLDDIVLKSITSWRQQIPRHRADLDMTRFPVAQLSFTGGGNEDGEPWFQEQISEEVQLNASAWDGRLNFVSGFFTFWESGLSDTTIAAFPGLLDVITETKTSIDNWTWALFGQATLDVTDWLSLTAGLRYTEDTKEAGLVVLNRNVSPPVVNQDVGDSATFTSWTPMASVAMPAPDSWLEPLSLDYLMTYFTYSRGFRGGGFNALITVQAPGELSSFQPETLDNFELGFKSIALENRLITNIALFYGIYDDIQVPTTRVFVDSGGNLQFESLTLNAASATNKGLELEVQALPVEGAQITGSVGLLDARYDSFTGINEINGQPIDRAGEAFPRVPKWQTHLAVQYSFPIEAMETNWLQGWLTPRLEWYYQSSMNIAGPELTQGHQPGYNLLHARLSYDFWDDRAQVALWGKNLTDSVYFDNLYNYVQTIGTITRYYQTPRTFGAELSVRF